MQFNTDDPRLGDYVKACTLSDLHSYSQSRILSQPPRSGIVIVGFPYDEGTIRNGGRAGSCDGPDAARRFIHGRMGTLVNPETGIDLTVIDLYDIGDIPRGMKLEEAHKQLQNTVRQVLEFGYIPFVIGGSNDQSYLNYSAFADYVYAHYPNNVDDRLVVINIDAHLG